MNVLWVILVMLFFYIFFFQAEDGIRDGHVTGVQTCALPICPELRGTSRLRGDVGEAQLVDIISSEVPFNEVVVTGRAGALPVLALLDPGGGVPLVVAADPPRGASAHRLSGLRSFVCQQPVAESTVVAVGVWQHVGSIRLDDLSLGDLPTPPAVVGLPGELQDPQGHPDGDTVSGELAQERLEPFPGRFACER